MVYYVYALFRPDGTPFYVGKGKGNRISHHGTTHGSNDYANKIINKAKREGLECPRVILREGLNELEAFEYEILFIKAIGRKDLEEGPLVNFTDGGEGASGRKCSPETIAKMCNSHKAIMTEEMKKKISDSKKGKKLSQEAIRKSAESRKGIKLSSETRIKMSRAAKNRPSEFWEKVSNTLKGHAFHGNQYT